MPGLFGGKNPGETWRAICYFTGNPPTQSAEEPEKSYFFLGLKVATLPLPEPFTPRSLPKKRWTR